MTAMTASLLMSLAMVGPTLSDEMIPLALLKVDLKSSMVIFSSKKGARALKSLLSTSASTSEDSSSFLYWVVIFIWLSPPNCLTSTAPSNSAMAAWRISSAVTGLSKRTT